MRPRRPLRVFILGRGSFDWFLFVVSIYLDYTLICSFFHTRSIFTAFPIQAFEAPMSFSDFVALRGALDSPYRGLTWIEFQIMVGECTGCNRIMLMRSKDHHRCRGKNAPPQLVSQGQLFGLLDSTAGGQGVTHKQYLQTFASCVLCQRIFTRTAAVRHRGCHGLDSESEAELESEEE